MKPNELRIGNYVNSEVYGIFPIVALTIGEDFYSSAYKSTTYYPMLCKLDDITPIPLTEEWLLEFGGIDANYCIYIKAKRKTIIFNYFSKIISSGIRSGWYCKKYKHIKYVHQLQNLYFALTGKELIIVKSKLI